MRSSGGLPRSSGFTIRSRVRIVPDPQGALFEPPPAGDEIDQKLRLMETLVPPRDEIDEKLELIEERFLPRFTLGLHSARGTEVSGGGYSRQPYPRRVGDAVTFPTATAPWGMVRCAAVYDQHGNLLAEFDLTKTAMITAGDTLVINLEGFDFSAGG